MLIPLLISAFFTLALAQGPPPAPLEVSIAFTGQSSSDPTKPNVEVTLTNTSGHSVKVLQPGADGFFRNLQVMVLPEGQDSLFVDLDPTLGEDLMAGRSVQVKPLKAGESLTTVVDLFSGAYGISVPAGSGFQVQVIYQSVYRTGDPETDPRAAVWPEPVYSNLLVYP